LSRYRPSRNSVSGDSTLDGDVTVSGSLDVTKNLEGVRRYLLDDEGDGLGYGGVVGEILTLYVDDTSGNDKNDGLTSGSALKTIKKCIERAPSGMEAWDVNGLEQAITVIVASGTYVCPTEIQSNNTVFVGATASVESASTWVQVSASNADGLIVDADFPSGDYAEDTLRGQWIKWGNSGTPQNNHGWIYANESGSGGTTRCYICHHNGAGSSPAAYGDIELINSDVRFEIPEDKRVGRGFANFHYSVELQFENITFDGNPAVTAGGELYLNGNQKVFFRNCKFGSDVSSNFKTIQSAQGFGLFTDCYFQLKQYIRSGAQGYTSLRSSVVDGRYGTGQLAATFDGTFNLKNEIIFRDSTKGFTTEGGVSTYDNTSANTCMRFMLFNGVVNNSNGIQANTEKADLFGGQIDLPDLYGAVSSNYGITATGGANVYMGENSSLSSSLGINYVSADGGTSNVAQTKFLTSVSGGNVPFLGYETSYSASAPSDWTAPAPDNAQDAIDRLAAAVEGLLGGAIP
jgi:hypothetical protein